MSRFLRTLVKVGLVELNPEEQERVNAPSPASQAESDDVDALLRETEALIAGGGPANPPPKAAPSRAPVAAKPPPLPSAQAQKASAGPTPTSIPEGRALADIYAEARIEPCPFPAEKLNRLLDGLKAMDPAMRHAAVMAMDAADDAWSIVDPLQDAQRKVAALQRAKNELAAVVGASEAQAERDLKAADAYQAEATEKIRAQISELEALLQEELTSVANRRATSQSKLQGTREAAAREAARLDQEINALNGLLVAFAPPAAPRS